MISSPKGSMILPGFAPPVDIVLAEVLVVGMTLVGVLEVGPLALEMVPHSLSTLDNTFSGAVLQYAT